MTLRELTAKTGFTPRQIRFLIAEGFCPGPSGGRKFAQYGEEHLKAIRRHQRLRELGFPPAAIRRLRQAKAGYARPIADGITLVIAEERMGAGDPVEPLLERVREELEQALRAPSEAAPGASRSPTGRPAPVADPSLSPAVGAPSSPARSAADALRPSAGNRE